MLRVVLKCQRVHSLQQQRQQIIECDGLHSDAQMIVGQPEALHIPVYVVESITGLSGIETMGACDPVLYVVNP